MWEPTARKSPETIESVLVFDTKDGQVRELCAEACGFQYRTSIFNTSERGRFIILRVTYGLMPGGKPRIEYADLKNILPGFQQTPSLTSTREAVRRIRATKAMLITPGDEDCRSAGSFFKNPVLAPNQYEDLTRRATAKGLQIPSYPALDALRKFQPPGWWSTPASARVTAAAGRDLAQARVGHREPRRSHRRRHPGIERPYSAARGRTLGHSARTGAGVRWASELVPPNQSFCQSSGFLENLREHLARKLAGLGILV